MNLMLCCNSPDNGLFDHKAGTIELTLPSGGKITVQGWDVVVRDKGLYLIMGRIKLPYQRSREWVGNWCWNAYHVGSQERLRSLANYLRRHGWSPEEGPEDAFVRWEAPGEITAEEWVKL